MNVFPVTPAYSMIKRPIWNTLIFRSISLKEKRVGQTVYPVYEFDLAFQALTDAEIRLLIGFFNQCHGALDPFLIADPTDHAITGQQLGLGTGARTDFQLVRAYGGFTEPILYPQAGQKVYVNGTLQSSGYSMVTGAIVRFATPPALNAVVTADFSFYYQVRFKDDSNDLEYFAYQLWNVQKITLVSVKD